MALKNSFLELCKTRFEKINSVLCIGLDPVIEKFPAEVIDKDSIENTLINFFFPILQNYAKYALAVKPNIAFYEQYGIEGLVALKKIIKKAQSLELPVILDAKRGDIGNTSLAYAKATFDDLGADAVTLAPYMGEDSLSPFFSYKEKGFFILARTSNPGSKDFQLLTVGEQSLYQAVSAKIAEWKGKYAEGIGAVAGATHTEELSAIAGFFASNDYPPLLIPGVGKQGGSFTDVVSILKANNYPLERVFINSSSGILYAHQTHTDVDWLSACEIEIKKMLLDS